VLLLGAAIAVVLLLVTANALPGLSTLAPSGAAVGSGSPASPAVTKSSPTAAPSSIAPAGASVNDRIDELGAAIDGARGGNDGLRGRDANDLAGRLDAVKEALAASDVAAARDAAASLEGRIGELAKDQRLADTKRDRLAAAAAALVDALRG